MVSEEPTSQSRRELEKVGRTVGLGRFGGMPGVRNAFALQIYGASMYFRSRAAVRIRDFSPDGFSSERLGSALDTFYIYRKQKAFISRKAIDPECCAAS